MNGSGASLPRAMSRTARAQRSGSAPAQTREKRSVTRDLRLRAGRQPVRDALVAIDAGLFLARERGRVLRRGALALAREVHGLEVVAVAALERVVGLQARPLVLRELEALPLELLLGADGAEDLAPHLLRRLHLARELVGPVVRHMAIRARGAHAGAVGVVDGGLELREDVL